MRKLFLMIENGHWKFSSSFDSEEWFGFIYCIENTVTSQFYIGKKQVVSIRKRKFGKKETAALTDKRMKKYEMVTKESDWLEYRSSNKVVKEWFDNNDKAYAVAQLFPLTL